MSVPKLDVSQAKLDKLARDFESLKLAPAVSGSGVPAFQRQGYLEKLGGSRKKWFKRFFVLRDSFLLSYNLQKSDLTVEPRACVHLANAKFQFVPQGGKDYCIQITTQDNDRVLLAAATKEEREAWVKDLEIAKTITHANMVKLAVENRCLAEQKGVLEVVGSKSASSLALFANPEYVQGTPLTGGREGWLRTSGFNVVCGDKGGTSPSVHKRYFLLRDSHLLMFHGGDALTKPRGCMFLVGTTAKLLDAGGTPGSPLFFFSVQAAECGDFIELAATSEKQRKQWVEALQVGSRVTHRDFRLLLKEHELLASVVMTPRAAAPAKPNEPAPKAEAPPAPLLAEDVDVQGKQLDPGTLQPYDEDGNALFRNPDGKLVTHSGALVPPTAPRFSATGEQLDPFNRPLPPGAVPMFTNHAQPIGVGPDGKHYLPDGTVVAQTDPHFDSEGRQLPQGIVDAANSVATDISVAIQVRARLKGQGAPQDAVDVLGRTFRAQHPSDKGTFVNADGDHVPLQTARKVTAGTGQLVALEEAPGGEGEEENEVSGTLVIRVDEEDGDAGREIGEVHVDGKLTLKDVRHLIHAEVEQDFPDFVFLVGGVQMLAYEEGDRLAASCLPAVTIRGKDIKTIEAPKPKFNKRVEAMLIAESNKKKEREEFDLIMAKVREGQFLKSVKPQA